MPSLGLAKRQKSLIRLASRTRVMKNGAAGTDSASAEKIVPSLRTERRRVDFREAKSNFKMKRA